MGFNSVFKGLILWLRLHSVRRIYGACIQWPDKPTGLPLKTAYMKYLEAFLEIFYVAKRTG
jgi:hypothetical protein